MTDNSRRISRTAALSIVIGVAVVAIAAAVLAPAIPQSLDYHAFADGRTILGVPNFFNVVSNLPFVVVGIVGLLAGRALRRPFEGIASRAEAIPYLTLFAGVLLTGLGSAWYHLAPTNGSLVWDRIPMTIVFTSFLAATIVERIDRRAGLLLLPFLLAAGAGSVLYWHATELAGAGDLRPYALVQFYPMLAIPLIMALFPARYSGSGALIGAVVLYAVAKVFELLDGAIFGLGGVVSGHTLKHLAAAGATWWVARMVRNRERVRD